MIWQLLIGTATKIVQPVETPKLVIKTETGEAFRRAKLTGDLVLTGSDYAFVNSQVGVAGCCQVLIIQVFEVCNGERKKVGESECPVNALEWDYDECTVTASKLKTIDKYSGVFTYWETEVNLMEYPEIIYFESSQRDVLVTEFNPKASRKHRARYLLGAIRWLWGQTLEPHHPELVEYMSMPEEVSQYLGSPINPYTGQTNFLAMVVLEHMADAKRPEASNPTTIAKVSLKSLLEGLKGVLNCWWDIEETGIPERPYRIRLEHKSFFPHGSYAVPPVTLDLTDSAFAKRITAKRKATPLTDRLYGEESLVIALNDTLPTVTNEETAGIESERDKLYKKWRDIPESRWPEWVHKALSGGLTPETNFNYKPSQEFVRAKLRYDTVCAPRDDKGELTKSEQVASLLGTHFVECLYRPSEVPDNGFVLVEIEDKPGAPTVRQTATNRLLYLSREEAINANLAATNLWATFHMADRSFATGNLSVDRVELQPIKNTIAPPTNVSRPVKSKSILPFIQLSEYKISGCECSAIDITGRIKTWFGGDGTVEELNWNLETGEISLNIVHTDKCTQGEIPDAPPVPCEDCKPYGTFLRSQNNSQKCADGVTVMRRIYTTFHSTGECDENGKCTEFKIDQIRPTGNC